MSRSDAESTSPDVWVLVWKDRADRCRERALVLEAVGIPVRTERRHWTAQLYVPVPYREQALTEIQAYERENAGWPPVDDAPSARIDGIVSALVYGLVLAIVFWLDKRAMFGQDWWDAGRTQAGAIRAGEWWRTITALTLHSNLAHLAGNLFFGGFFGVLVCRAVGVGSGWLSILAAGLLGNTLNAFLQPPGHSSVGASTAVFGAIGILTTYYWRLRHRLGQRRLRRWGPLLAGAVLLNWLGAGGERTDVAGHCCGMAVGLVIGVLHGATHGLVPPGITWRQNILALVAAGIVVGAWIIALWH